MIVCLPMTSRDGNLEGEVLFWGKNLPTVISVSYMYLGIKYMIHTISISDMLVSLRQRGGLVSLCVKEIGMETFFFVPSR